LFIEVTFNGIFGLTILKPGALSFGFFNSKPFPIIATNFNDKRQTTND